MKAMKSHERHLRVTYILKCTYCLDEGNIWEGCCRPFLRYFTFYSTSVMTILEKGKTIVVGEQVVEDEHIIASSLILIPKTYL